VVAAAALGYNLADVTLAIKRGGTLLATDRDL